MDDAHTPRANTKVVSLDLFRDQQRPHWSGEVVCLGCQHIWAAVWPCRTDTEPAPDYLECPRCHRWLGVSRGAYSTAAGQLEFVCWCGNRLFSLRPDGLLCPGCGRRYAYDSLGNIEPLEG